MELVAADDAGAIGAGLLHVDDGGVDLGHGHGHHLLAGNHRILDLGALQVLQLGHGLALLLADTPVLHQAGALHQAHRQEGQAQGGGVKHQHQHILGVVLIGQLPLLDGGAEAAGDVGVAGVGGIAVDVGGHPLLADEHVHLAAAGAGVDDKVLLALAQNLIHRCVGLAVGGKAADGEDISALDEFCHSVVHGIYLVHSNTPITKNFGFLFSLNCQGAATRFFTVPILPQISQQVYIVI